MTDLLKNWTASPKRFGVLVLIVCLAAASRLIPHPPNVTPVAALALFGGAHFADRRLAVLVPLAALLVGAFVIGFHELVPFVYGGFALIAVLGFWLRGRRSAGRITGAALGGSVTFFLVSNFGVWLLLGTYPMTPAGLVACYVAGLPYFWNTLLGDLVFTGVLFGGFALLERAVPALQAAPSPAGADAAA